MRLIAARTHGPVVQQLLRPLQRGADPPPIVPARVCQDPCAGASACDTAASGRSCGAGDVPQGARTERWGRRAWACARPQGLSGQTGWFLTLRTGCASCLWATGRPRGKQAWQCLSGQTSDCTYARLMVILTLGDTSPTMRLHHQRVGVAVCKGAPPQGFQDASRSNSNGTPAVLEDICRCCDASRDGDQPRRVTKKDCEDRRGHERRRRVLMEPGVPLACLGEGPCV